MRHADTESYILGNGGVESALGNVGVESLDTSGTTGDGAVLRDESLGATGIETGDTETGTRVFLLVQGRDEAEEETKTGSGDRSGPHTSCILSTGNTENLLKRGNRSG